MLFVTIMNKKPANMNQFQGLHEVVHLLQKEAHLFSWNKVLIRAVSKSLTQNQNY